MVNLINYTHLWLLLSLCYLAGISTLPLEGVDSTQRLRNDKQSQLNIKGETTIRKHNDENKNDEIYKNSSDLLMTATDYQHPRFRWPVSIKYRSFNMTENRSAVPQKQNETPPQLAAQNFYNNYFPETPPLTHNQPYYSLVEDPIIAKFLSQNSQEFEPRQKPLTSHDASILGSGDFGVLRGGTFYSGEEQSYINEDASDFYYGDASNTHTEPASTEGYIEKYTYPEEQFAQFRDFADLGTPADSAFSQFVVVYAAKNSTSDDENSKPKNIFEQLQEIDKEKSREQRKLKKTQTNPSITKLKLVKTKQMEKKWNVQKPPTKVIDDDPLIALS